MMDEYHTDDVAEEWSLMMMTRQTRQTAGNTKQMLPQRAEMVIAMVMAMVIVMVMMMRWCDDDDNDTKRKSDTHVCHL